MHKKIGLMMSLLLLIPLLIFIAGCHKKAVTPAKAPAPSPELASAQSSTPALTTTEFETKGDDLILVYKDFFWVEFEEKQFPRYRYYSYLIIVDNCQNIYCGDLLQKQCAAAQAFMEIKDIDEKMEELKSKISREHFAVFYSPLEEQEERTYKPISTEEFLKYYSYDWAQTLTEKLMMLDNNRFKKDHLAISIVAYPEPLKVFENMNIENDDIYVLSLVEEEPEAIYRYIKKFKSTLRIELKNAILGSNVPLFENNKSFERVFKHFLASLGRLARLFFSPYAHAKEDHCGSINEFNK